MSSSLPPARPHGARGHLLLVLKCAFSGRGDKAIRCRDCFDPSRKLQSSAPTERFYSRFDTRGLVLANARPCNIILPRGGPMRFDQLRGREFITPTARVVGGPQHRYAEKPADLPVQSS